MKKLSCQLIAATSLWVLCGHAQDYDFEAEYSTTSNPGSVWSYRYQAGTPQQLRDGNYDLLTTLEDNFAGLGAGFSAWHMPTLLAPLVGLNGTANSFNIGGAGPIEPGESFLSPGFLELAVVQWTAPFSGIIDIAYGFADRQTGGDGIAWFVDKGDASGNLAAGTYNDGGNTGVLHILGLSVVAGDQINFVIDAQQALGVGDNSADLTRLYAHITVIPEPGTVALVVVGLGGLAVARRRSLVRN